MKTLLCKAETPALHCADTRVSNPVSFWKGVPVERILPHSHPATTSHNYRIPESFWSDSLLVDEKAVSGTGSGNKSASAVSPGFARERAGSLTERLCPEGFRKAAVQKLVAGIIRPPDTVNADRLSLRAAEDEKRLVARIAGVGRGSDRILLSVRPAFTEALRWDGFDGGTDSRVMGTSCSVPGRKAEYHLQSHPRYPDSDRDDWYWCLQGNPEQCPAARTERADMRGPSSSEGTATNRFRRRVLVVHSPVSRRAPDGYRNINEPTIVLRHQTQAMTSPCQPGGWGFERIQPYLCRKDEWLSHPVGG